MFIASSDVLLVVLTGVVLIVVCYVMFVGWLPGSAMAALFGERIRPVGLGLKVSRFT